jgi:nucleoside-diphosphate-sugar epimerase
MIINLVRKRRLPVPSSGGGFATFIYLEDAAAATVAALEKRRAGKAYNIVDDESARWADYLDALATELGVHRPWRVPSWLLRPIPYLHAIMTTSMRSRTPRPGASWTGHRRCRPTARASRSWHGRTAERPLSGTPIGRRVLSLDDAALRRWCEAGPLRPG